MNKIGAREKKNLETIMQEFENIFRENKINIKYPRYIKRFVTLLNNSEHCIHFVVYEAEI
jgi:hypothetical protein